MWILALTRRSCENQIPLLKSYVRGSSHRPVGIAKIRSRYSNLLYEDPRTGWRRLRKPDPATQTFSTRTLALVSGGSENQIPLLKLWVRGSSHWPAEVAKTRFRYSNRRCEDSRTDRQTLRKSDSTTQIAHSAILALVGSGCGNRIPLPQSPLEGVFVLTRSWARRRAPIPKTVCNCAFLVIAERVEGSWGDFYGIAIGLTPCVWLWHVHLDTARLLPS